MAELALVDELSDEQRSELDAIERGTPDLERQIRAVMVAAETEERDAETEERDAETEERDAETEERDAETRETAEPDAKLRERIELRGKAMLTNYVLAAARGRMVDGVEMSAAAGVSGIPLEARKAPHHRRGGGARRPVSL